LTLTTSRSRMNSTYTPLSFGSCVAVAGQFSFPFTLSFVLILFYLILILPIIFSLCCTTKMLQVFLIYSIRSTWLTVN
jgi:hypothetical protein